MDVLSAVLFTKIEEKPSSLLFWYVCGFILIHHLNQGPDINTLASKNQGADTPQITWFSPPII